LAPSPNDDEKQPTQTVMKRRGVGTSVRWEIVGAVLEVGSRGQSGWRTWARRDAGCPENDRHVPRRWRHVDRCPPRSVVFYTCCRVGRCWIIDHRPHPLCTGMHAPHTHCQESSHTGVYRWEGLGAYPRIHNLAPKDHKP